MDDDDIEDLYDDLDDISDDLDMDKQPVTVKAWLSCQTRWWKSRFQRKHRSEKLIQGCGRQLMHWQVKVSCSNDNNNNNSNNNGPQQSISCQQWLLQPPVIRETVADRTEPRAAVDQTRGRAYDDLDVNDVAVAARNDDDVKNVTGAFLDQDTLPSDADHKTTHNRRTYGKTRSRDDDYDDDDNAPEWWFERAHDLEYRLHKTDWMYRRARERDFQRQRPRDWYHRRVEARDSKHHRVIGQQ